MAAVAGKVALICRVPSVFNHDGRVLQRELRVVTSMKLLRFLSVTSRCTEEICSVPYLSEVDMVEEEELPAKYVPPPPISEQVIVGRLHIRVVTDVSMRCKVEDVMYTLLASIQEPLTALVDDSQKWSTLMEVFSESLEIEDPLICMRGLHGFENLLKVFCRSVTAVTVHELYYENVAVDRTRRWIYVVWTVTLTDDLESIPRELDFAECIPRKSKLDPAEYPDYHESSLHMNEDSENHQEVEPSQPLRLSGESRLEVDGAGKVIHISSRWFRLSGHGERDVNASKLWLSRLYSKEGGIAG